LGIAAAQTSTGNSISDLRADFDRINDLINTLLGDVQQKLGTISWPMRFLDQIAGNTDSKISNFSIVLTREAAWKVATDLAAMNNPTDQKNYISTLDANVAKLGTRIANPGCWANIVLKPAKWFEKGSVGEIVGVICSK